MDRSDVSFTFLDRIREIEEKLMALEEKYPDCVKMPGEGESAAAGNAGSGQEKFPDFQGKDLDGKEVNSSELFSGNTVTVVNFWFTTCKPCVGELADLDALNQELAQKGGAVVGINAFTLDGDEGAIAEAKEILSKKGASYQNLWFDSDSDPAVLPQDCMHSQRPMSLIRTGTSWDSRS